MHRTTRPLRRHLALAVVACTALVGAGCSGDEDANGDTTTTVEDVAGSLTAEQATPVAEHYADGVYASYQASVASATELQASVQAFTDDPTEANLTAAKDQWLAARDDYGPTEAFRFYDGPIDDPDDGPEGRINAWPMDEAYVDYVEGDPTAGIINNAADVPEITAEVLVSANEEGGETNISTGWHAIEFLLWGQDTDPEGPGARPATDYATAPNAARRATYLNLLADLLVADLTSVRDQWNPEGGPYRTEFLADPTLAVQHILRGMGALSSGELAGERMAVPYETKEQEDEHSCFSDNTLNDIIGNARGVRLAYTAEYEGVQGDSLSAVVARLAPEVDADLRKQLDNNVAAAEALPGPFDQMIQRDDDDPGRVELLALVEDLQDQGDAIAALASSLGLDISIEI